METWVIGILYSVIPLVMFFWTVGAILILWIVVKRQREKIKNGVDKKG